MAGAPPARPRRLPGSRGAALAAAAGGYLLLLLAWGMSNPPFASPDESAHYVRALGLGGGELVGERAEIPVPPSPTREQLRLIRFGNRFAREVTVPGGLSPAGFECNWADPTRSAACQDEIVPEPATTQIVTYVGGYPPLAYAAPGVVARLGDDPGTANRLGRVPALLSTAALIALAIALFAAGAPGAALLGPLVAITPLAVYLGAMLNPNGLETAAALAFAASVLRLSRTDHPPAWAWGATAGTGVVLALTRVPTPVWIVLVLVLLVLLRGPRGTARLVRGSPRAAAATGAALVAAIAVNRVWEHVHNSPLAAGGGGGSSGFDLSETGRVFSQVIGYLAYGEFSFPPAATAAWWTMVAVLVLAALVVGSWHHRAVLLATLATAALLPSVLEVILGGFDFFGRYFLPVLVAVPLLAAEIVSRRSDRLPRRVLAIGVPALAAVAAAVQLSGWWVNARRFAIGTEGPVWFLGVAEWSPPLGWWPWIVCATLGAAALAAAGVLAARSPARAGDPPPRPGRNPGRLTAGTAR